MPARRSSRRCSRWPDRCGCCSRCSATAPRCSGVPSAPVGTSRRAWPRAGTTSRWSPAGRRATWTGPTCTRRVTSGTAASPCTGSRCGRRGTTASSARSTSGSYGADRSLRTTCNGSGTGCRVPICPSYRAGSATTRRRFDTVIFFTYLYPHTAAGLDAVAGVVPTVLHPLAARRAALRARGLRPDLPPRRRVRVPHRGGGDARRAALRTGPSLDHHRRGHRPGCDRPQSRRPGGVPSGLRDRGPALPPVRRARRREQGARSSSSTCIARTATVTPTHRSSSFWVSS